MRAWLFRVCANIIVSQGRRRVVSDRAIRFLIPSWTATSPEEVAMRRDDEQRLRQALDRIRPEERVSLLLSAAGLSAEEIGRATGRDANATRVSLWRSRLRLRRYVAELEGPEP